MAKKLEVGCGDRKREGYMGMDIVQLPSVDVVHDMNITPWQFGDNTFDEIIFDDVLEHSKNFLGILSEVYRVSVPNAIIKISLPHFSSDNMYSDPTHTIFFSSRSFNYFDKSLNYKHSFYLQSVNFKIIKSHISFRESFTIDGKKSLFNPFKWIGIEFLVNKYQRIYERFFCWILPATELYFELKVIKD
ncbi:MAG: methyltransferase domain-containing protein [Ignavibacteriaceae bacterium]